MIRCCHDSQDTMYRKPTGALRLGERAELCIRAEGDVSNLSCSLHLSLHLSQTPDDVRQISMSKEAAEEGACIFRASMPQLDEAGLVMYHFILEDGQNRWFYGNNEERLGGQGALYTCEPPEFQITVYKPSPVPKWYKDSIVYQIFPDRFARDDDWQAKQQAAYRGPEWKGARRVIQQDWYDLPYYTRNSRGEVTRWPFFGGSLQGIRDKLFYLKSMGVGAVYLNPIFAASSNHKYDTADYMKTDPAFGTEEDFRLLCEDAARLGIRIILDGVFNHTGADSRYFDFWGNYDTVGACRGEESPYYSWYRFERFPDKYDCWWGVGDLPNVEENNPSYRSFIYGDDDSVIRRWMRAGASGWRLDVADELPDDFIAGIRKAVKDTDPEGLLMGEVWEDASNKVSYGVRRKYLLGDELDSVMNYPVRDLLLDYMSGKSDAGTAVRKLNSLAENYPPENFYGALNLTGSHDRARTLTVLGDAPEDLDDTARQYYRLPEDKLNLARRRMKALSLIQYVLPGVPCLYYGDEAGVQGYEDPYNRATYPWGREDNELMLHYRMLAQIRKQYNVLTDGGYRFSAQGEHLFICERFYDDECIIAVVNRHIFGSQTVNLQLPAGTEYVLELLNSEEVRPEQVKQEQVMSEQAGAEENAGKRIVAELPPVSMKLYYCSGRRHERLNLPRSAGVLCHVSSLPSGNLDGAEEFIDSLVAAGQKLWQILPLNPADEDTGSPYSSPAVFAGNTGLMGNEAQHHRETDSNLEEEYARFCREEDYWLEDFALYTVIKEAFGGKPWQQWPAEERDRRNLDKWKSDRESELEDIKKAQFLFDRRWKAVREYANSRGASVIGDIPVYAAADSADTWAHRDVFLLDDEGYPQVGAGVPPDYFSEDGQHWGNPLYDWDALKKNDYAWWLKRVERAVARYDYIRLDHFRSFAAFFAVPRGGKPRDGWWIPGAGIEFFRFLESRLGPLPFLAEDLGALDNQVHNLLKLTGYPGMLVYQFSADEIAAMDGDKAAGKILYSGTHDNRTLAGWAEDNRRADEIISRLYETEAPWVILPLQDILGLGDESRMNIPGKAYGNWQWRAQEGCMTEEICRKMREEAEKNER